MAYYENRIEHLGGDLILYQRNLATAAPNVKSHRQPKWYMKLRVGPRKIINRSTGLTIYEDEQVVPALPDARHHETRKTES